MLSESFQTGVYFYQPDETAISQGRTVFIPQGTGGVGISPLSEESQPSEEFLMLSLQIYDRVLVSFVRQKWTGFRSEMGVLASGIHNVSVLVPD